MHHWQDSLEEESRPKSRLLAWQLSNKAEEGTGRAARPSASPPAPRLPWERTGGAWRRGCCSLSIPSPSNRSRTVGWDDASLASSLRRGLWIVGKKRLGSAATRPPPPPRPRLLPPVYSRCRCRRRRETPRRCRARLGLLSTARPAARSASIGETAGREERHGRGGASAEWAGLDWVGGALPGSAADPPPPPLRGRWRSMRFSRRCSPRPSSRRGRHSPAAPHVT